MILGYVLLIVGYRELHWGSHSLGYTSRGSVIFRQGHVTIYELMNGMIEIV
jgi:hypothetical protein